MDFSLRPLITTSGDTRKIVDFKPPPPDSPLRVRPAAHLMTQEDIANYRKAIQLMEALPDDDPRRVWCENLDSQLLQVQNSPHLHRLFLYFHERLLRNLIQDHSYGIPYWPSDLDSSFPIPPMLLELGFLSPPTVNIDPIHASNNSTSTVPKTVAYNRTTMYRQLVSGAKTPKLFFGSPYRAAGDDEPEPGQGTFENLLHTQLHILSEFFDKPQEDRRRNFDTACRNAAFYGLHANADRLWEVWKSIHGQKRPEFMDPDWIDSSFVLYDENAQLVRVKVGDCLDPLKLRYTYQEIPIPWLDSRPNPKPKKTGESSKSAELPRTKIGTGDFPRTVDTVISVEVPRPRKSRSPKEKEDEEEVLLIRGIELLDTDAFMKFDVHINDEDYLGTSPIHTEFAGSFTNRPQKLVQEMKKKKRCWRIAMNEILEDLGAEDDDIVIVTIVPRAGTVTIGGVEIEFLSD